MDSSPQENHGLAGRLMRWRRASIPPPARQLQGPEQRLAFWRVAYPSWEINRTDVGWVADLRLPLTDRMRAAGIVQTIHCKSMGEMSKALADQAYLIILDRRHDRRDT
ncbi:hypothetical protein [Nonomuraea basaltis]|uniref:hypothetical protein n=1 Tax=Nonomuraea basaltis TaxID=2495887 RepID=UPI00110C5959|nr:hypothetical protein [Nonomuraea basaltis]TMR95595.1 hypothetical protein EJK15_27960 [Nonomuraea basaltis]